MPYLHRQSQTEQLESAAEIAKMIEAMAHSSDAEAVAHKVQLMVETVIDVPMGAVAEAARRFRCNEVTGQHQRFPPTATEFRIEAVRIFEATRPRGLPMPVERPEPPLTELEIAARRAYAEDVLADFHASRGIDPAAQRAEDVRMARLQRIADHVEEDRVRRCERAGIDPYANPPGWNPSPELVATLKGQHPHD